MSDSVIRRLLAPVLGSSLLTTAAGNLSLKVGAGLFGFLNSVILARLLGPKQFGVYVLAVTAVGLAATIATLGLPSLVTREVAGYEARQQWGLLKGLIRVCHLWTLVAVAIVLSVGAVLAGSGWLFSKFAWPIFVLAGLLIPLAAFGQLRAAILRGLHRVVLADIPELLVRPLLVFVLAGWTYLWLGHLDAPGALLFQVAATFLAVSIGLWFLYAQIPEAMSKSERQTQVGFWAKETRPFFLITIIGLLEGQVGIYLLGYFSGSDQIGLFQVANQMGALVVLGLTAVNLPLQPKLVSAWAKDNKIEAQRLVTEASKTAAILALLAALVLIPFSNLFIRIYGHGYLDAANVLRVIVIGQVINAISGPCGLVLSATGHQKFAFYGVGAALSVNTLACLFLVPAYAALGASVAVLFSLVVWNGMMVYWTRRLVGIDTVAFGFKIRRGGQ